MMKVVSHVLFLAGCLMFCGCINWVFVDSNIGSDTSNCTKSDSPCRTFKYLHSRNFAWNKSEELNIFSNGSFSINSVIVFEWPRRIIISPYPGSVTQPSLYFSENAIIVFESGEIHNFKIDGISIGTVFSITMKGGIYNCNLNLSSIGIEVPEIRNSVIQVGVNSRNSVGAEKFDTVIFNGPTSGAPVPSPFSFNIFSIVNSEFHNFHWKTKDDQTSCTISNSHFFSKSCLTVCYDNYIEMNDVTVEGSLISKFSKSFVNISGKGSLKVKSSTFKNTDSNILFSMFNEKYVQSTALISIKDSEFSSNNFQKSVVSLVGKGSVELFSNTFVGNNGKEIVLIEGIPTKVVLDDNTFHDISNFDDLIECKGSVDIFIEKNSYEGKIKLDCSSDCTVNSGSCGSFENSINNSEEVILWYYWGIPAIVIVALILCFCICCIICTATVILVFLVIFFLLLLIIGFLGIGGFGLGLGGIGFGFAAKGLKKGDYETIQERGLVL